MNTVPAENVRITDMAAAEPPWVYFIKDTGKPGALYEIMVRGSVVMLPTDFC
jgi:hypothetical protein